MSQNQLSALLAKIKDDAELLEKLRHAADLDAAVAVAQEAGFDVNKTDFHLNQAEQPIELSDEELETVAGGTWEVAAVVSLFACIAVVAGAVTKATGALLDDSNP